MEKRLERFVSGEGNVRTGVWGSPAGGVAEKRSSTNCESWVDKEVRIWLCWVIVWPCSAIADLVAQISDRCSRNVIEGSASILRRKWRKAEIEEKLFSVLGTKIWHDKWNSALILCNKANLNNDVEIVFTSSIFIRGSSNDALNKYGCCLAACLVISTTPSYTQPPHRA